MVKFKCELCGKVWYTSVTKEGQKCDYCGGELTKEE